jgi:hypothetical protein
MFENFQVFIPSNIKLPPNPGRRIAVRHILAFLHSLGPLELPAISVSVSAVSVSVHHRYK